TVGPLHMGIDGPAIATGVALLVIAAGFYRTATDCVGAAAVLNPVLLLPVIAGLVPSLALSGVPRIGVALVATLACGLLVLRLARPFQRDDLELVAALDMPRPLKRLALRGVALACR